MKIFAIITLAVSALLLQGCVHKLVTVPVKVAYKTTKGVAKGTVAVAKAVIPGDDDDDEDDKKSKKKKKDKDDD